MREAAVVWLAIGVCLFTAASAASAAGTTTVGIVPCVNNHAGRETVSAGSDVVFRFGWADRNYGLVQRFIVSVTSVFTVNGVSVPSPAFGPITDAVPGATYPFVTQQYLDAGTVGSEQSVTVTADYIANHYWEERNPDGTTQTVPAGGSFTGGPLSCTVTGG